MRISEPSAPTHRTSLVPRAAEAASSDLHIFSFIDATEALREPAMTESIKQFEKMKSVGGSAITAQVLIDRQPQSCARKLTQGLLYTGLMLAPLGAGVLLGLHGIMLGHGPGFTLGLPAGTPLAYRALCVAGGYAGWRATKYLATHGFMLKGLGAVASVAESKHMAEPVWSGRRTYEVTEDTTARIDSTVTAESAVRKENYADDLTRFFVSNMQKYPAGIHVLHTMGHGLAYRANSGLPFHTYEKVLADTTAQSGRPLDILMMATCLGSSFEALAATFPYARYTIASAEVTSGPSLGESLRAALAGESGDARTPRELASTVMDMRTSVETRELIDMEKIPALVGAVDTLGGLLSAEVAAGRGQYVRAAVEATPRYPKHPLLVGMKKKVALGDLKNFAECVGGVYAGQAVKVPGHHFGPFHFGTARQFAAAATTPQAAAIQAAAQQVQEAVDDAVLRKKHSAKYEAAGGISVQLPSKGLFKLEASTRWRKLQMTSFNDSAAPAGWKAFVNCMSEYLQK